MAANKRKILESARKLAQKGAKDKALKEYEKLLRLDPKDAKLRLEIGDAHRRWGQVEEAIDTYTKVAEQYMAEGFDARAVAVYKQIVNLDPDRLAAYAPLAELYERMGLSAEAIAALQTAADAYHRKGEKAEALSLLRKMANADPTNTTSRIKVADLLRQEAMTEDALAEYALAAEELERQGDVEALSGVYRRMLELDEKHVGALSALAKNLASRGKLNESIPLAERVLALDPSSPEDYETLAGLYEQAGRSQERSGVYRKLAELYRERGDEDMARGILQRFVPSHELAMSASDPDLPAAEPKAGGEGGADLFDAEFHAGDEAAQPPLDFGNEDRLDVARPPDDDVLLEFADDEPLPPAGSAGAAVFELEDAISLDQPVKAAPTPAPSPQRPVAAAPAAFELPESFDVEQLLAEASVYLRYGKRDRAVEHLERVLEAEPEPLAVLEKLGEMFAEAAESERAVEVWLRAAKRAQEAGEEAVLAGLRDRIAALDPAAVEQLEPAPVAPDPEPVAEPEIEVDLGGLEDELALDDAEEELLDEEILDEELSMPEMPAVSEPEPEPELEHELAPDLAAAEASASAAAGASLSASAAQQVQDDLEEADFYMEQGLLDEAEQIYQRVLSVAPSHPRALLRLGEVAAARGSAAPAAAPTAAPAPIAEPEPAPEALSIELPGDEPVVSEELEDLSDLDLEPESAATPEEEAEPDGSDTEEYELGAGEEAGEFDLAAALADAFEDEDDPGASQSGRPREDGFDAVFDAFKKGVSETLSESDHQAHYDLAIAYKEMGLHDDAIAELEIAMSDESRQAECLHLIALCAFDADRVPMAVEQLERLLALPGLAEDAALAARFDLGRALISLGDAEGAREAWSLVAAARPGFQDVEERLAELDLPEPEEESAGFESFDDVMESVFDDGDDPVSAAQLEPAEPELSPADLEPEPEPEVEAEPEPDPGAAAQPDGAPPGRDRKRRKKISFV